VVPRCVCLWHSHLQYSYLSLSPSGHLAPCESGPWLHRLKISTYCPRFVFLVLQVFSRRYSRKNFLTLAMGNTQSKIPLTHPWRVFYRTLLNWA
jgi:hypothetical protein